MNAPGFDPHLTRVRVERVAVLFQPHALVASMAGAMITVSRATTGEARVCAPCTAIAGLDGATFTDPASCLAYLTGALAQRPAGYAIKVAIAGADLSGQRAVLANGDGTVAYASAFQAGHRNAVHGLTTVAALAGAMVDVATPGPVISPGWGLTPGQPLFLGADGLITQTPPAPPAAFALQLGHAADPDTAVIRIGPPINPLDLTRQALARPVP